MSQNHPYLNVKWLCELANVSRSGYYNWVNNAGRREAREAKDREDFGLILKAYQQRGYDKGARSIYMQMLHWDPPVIMNLKKIRRLMDKFGLRCPIRKANPYRRMAKAIATDRKVKNILERRFELGPRKVLLTDITYIQFAGQTYYLSTLVDAYTKQVLSWKFSRSLELPFVLETLTEAMDRFGLEMDADTIIHSDQGCHYTSVKFGELVKDMNLIQSMSRRGNCWDNAVQESFYGHMKDSIDLSGCEDFEDAQAVIADYMDYYNTERYQWELQMLSPNEYYEYSRTGIHPLAEVCTRFQNPQIAEKASSSPQDAAEEQTGTTDLQLAESASTGLKTS